MNVLKKNKGQVQQTRRSASRNTRPNYREKHNEELPKEQDSQNIVETQTIAR